MLSRFWEIKGFSFEKLQAFLGREELN